MRGLALSCLLFCGGFFGCGASGTNAPATLDDAGGAFDGNGLGRDRGGPVSGGEAGGDVPRDLTSAEAPLGEDRPAVDRPPADGPVDRATSDVTNDLGVESTPPDTSPDMISCKTCDVYEKQYEAAFSRALSCTPDIKGQCLRRAQEGLACGCLRWVNSTTELDAIRKEWQTASCDKCAAPCPLLSCKPLLSGACEQRLLGSGTCVEAPLNGL